MFAPVCVWRESCFSRGEGRNDGQLASILDCSGSRPYLKERTESIEDEETFPNHSTCRRSKCSSSRTGIRKWPKSKLSHDALSKKKTTKALAMLFSFFYHTEISNQQQHYVIEICKKTVLQRSRPTFEDLCHANTYARKFVGRSPGAGEFSTP